MMRARPLTERVESARLAQVILVDFVRGEGTTEDPVRRCVGVFSTDGNWIATEDPIEPMLAMADRGMVR